MLCGNVRSFGEIWPNMTKTDRLTGILLLLQERPYTARELAERFEVSRRTVIRDAEALCQIGVPLIAQDGAGGGYSLPDDFNLEPLQLTRQVFFIRFALVFSIIITLTLALVYYNVGLGLRQKMMIMPGLLVFFAASTVFALLLKKPLRVTV